MAETTDGGLKCSIGVSLRYAVLKAWVVSHQQLQRKSAALWVAAVLWLPIRFFSWLDDLACWDLSLWDVFPGSWLL